MTKTKQETVVDLELVTGVQTPFTLTGEIDQMLAQITRKFLTAIRENRERSCKYRVIITAQPMKEDTE